jgi:hypothetical protein
MDQQLGWLPAAGVRAGQRPSRKGADVTRA